MVTIIIYKICCDECKYVYVGSTPKFIQRKSFHKTNTTNKNEKSGRSLYKIINENGGWENWRMVPVEECYMENFTKVQIKIKEEEWRLKLNSHNEIIENIEKEEIIETEETNEIIETEETNEIIEKKEKEETNEIIENEIINPDNVQFNELYGEGTRYIIYYIYRNDCNDCEFIYVGSTQNFRQRKSKHKINSNSINFKQQNKLYSTINEYGGWENWHMKPLEICDSSIQTKRQAELREEEWRLKLKAQLNSQRAFRSEEEKAEYNKQNCKDWNTDNKDHVKEQRKNYRTENAEKVKLQKAEFYETNKDEIRVKQTAYREENKDKITEQKKQHYQANKKEVLEKVNKYREENKEAINEKKKLKVKCTCGVIFRKEDKARHYRSVFHQNFIISNPTTEITFAIIE